MDTNTVNPTATVVTKRPRLKDSFAIGATEIIGSTCKGINALASITNGVATRITLHNASVYLDMVEDANNNEALVVNAINKTLEIGSKL